MLLGIAPFSIVEEAYMAEQEAHEIPAATELQTAQALCAHCEQPKETGVDEVKRCGICGHFVHVGCEHPPYGGAVGEAETSGAAGGVGGAGGLKVDWEMLEQQAEDIHRTRRRELAHSGYAVMVQTDDKYLQDHYSLVYQCSYCVLTFEIKHALVIHLLHKHAGAIGLRVKEGKIPFANEDADKG